MASNRNKANGSRYERELVTKLQDFGLCAARVPLSGSMAGYPGDIKVSDELVIECKSSRTGSGFKKLITWSAEHPVYQVGNLAVYSFEVWAAAELERVNGNKGGELADPEHVITSKLAFTFVHKAFDQGECAADFVACRMPRAPWIFIKRLS